MDHKKSIRKNMVYHREKVEEAVRMVKSGSSIREAARMNGIPNTTLRDKIMGKYSNLSPGKNTVFSTDVEQRIVKWLLDNAKKRISGKHK